MRSKTLGFSARLIRVAAIVGLLLAAVPAARAVRPLKPLAPEFPKDAAWINSKPLPLKRLRGHRVVLVTFINLYSANSIRTLPWLKRLWKQYALKGLMIIGVHSPDFAFDRDPTEIRHAVDRFGIDFPVFIDGKRRVWEAYRNDGWPAHYLLDPKSRIIHDKIGEGGYAEFEREILLALDKHGWRAPKDHTIPKDPVRKECGEATVPFYLGGKRGKEMLKIRPRKITAITEGRNGEIAVMGKWTTESGAIRFRGDKRRLRTRMRLIYKGAEAMAVFSRMSRRPGRMYIKQDDAWLHSGNANVDIEWDDDDRSYVSVDHPRLYYLTRNTKHRLNELTLYPDEAGVGVSSFEFSDYCQTDYEHK